MGRVGMVWMGWANVLYAAEGHQSVGLARTYTHTHTHTTHTHTRTHTHTHAHTHTHTHTQRHTHTQGPPLPPLPSTARPNCTWRHGDNPSAWRLHSGSWSSLVPKTSFTRKSTKSRLQLFRENYIQITTAIRNRKTCLIWPRKDSRVSRRTHRDQRQRVLRNDCTNMAIRDEFT